LRTVLHRLKNIPVRGGQGHRAACTIQFKIGVCALLEGLAVSPYHQALARLDSGIRQAGTCGRSATIRNEVSTGIKWLIAFVVKFDPGLLLAQAIRLSTVINSQQLIDHKVGVIPESIGGFREKLVAAKVGFIGVILPAFAGNIKVAERWALVDQRSSLIHTYDEGVGTIRDIHIKGATALVPLAGVNNGIVFQGSEYSFCLLTELVGNYRVK